MGLEEHLSRQAERSQSFFWNRLRWDLVCSRLPATRPAELVDVGAGTGFLGDVLASRFPNVAYRYIEPLESLEDTLANRFGAEANRRESETFGEADFVTLLDVLEHQEDDVSFLRDLAAKMAPGSTLILTVPAMPSLWSEWDVVLGHFRRYRKDTLLSAVGDSPLEVVELSYLFPELLPLGWLRRIRRGAADASSNGAGAEFPDLPSWVNNGLYRVGRGSMRMRRRWPAGTSLLAVMRRTGPGA
ncbi:MAG TPA: methyltransferase domain-containing protein [Solirubrobacterales bacterium]|nr:methyltransferase domain-containing protein [Solirubrobacterales bacterium]